MTASLDWNEDSFSTSGSLFKFVTVNNGSGTTRLMIMAHVTDLVLAIAKTISKKRLVTRNFTVEEQGQLERSKSSLFAIIKQVRKVYM